MRSSAILSLLVCLAAQASTVLMSGGSFLTLVDLPSLIFVLFPAVVMTAGDQGWRAMGGAFASAYGKTGALGKSEARLRAELLAAKALSRYAWTAALLGSLLGIVMVLASIAAPLQPQRIGRNMAVCLLTLFTAGFFELLVFGTLKGRIERLLAEMN